MSRVGQGKFIYEHMQDFPRLPAGQTFGIVNAVEIDSQDRLYVFRRAEPPMLVFDRDGNYLNGWGTGNFAWPHSVNIVDDVAYLTDRKDSVAMVYTLDGKPLQIFGTRGVPSDTGCNKSGDLVPRAAGPFNRPTGMSPGPSGDIYVTDGYRNARVHRFSRDGQLIQSWGQPGKSAPGDFHLPHDIVIDPDGKLYICDRGNQRVQIFTPDGEFVDMWTGMGGPNGIARDRNGLFYICEQEIGDAPPFIQVRDAAGNMLARWPSRHAHDIAVDSRGDIYVGLNNDCSVDKYVLCKE